MAIHINEVLTVLDTICVQQQAISEKLLTLIKTFKTEPAPVEPVLRSLLLPINIGLIDMKEMLSMNLQEADYSETRSG